MRTKPLWALRTCSLNHAKTKPLICRGHLQSPLISHLHENCSTHFQYTTLGNLYWKYSLFHNDNSLYIYSSDVSHPDQISLFILECLKASAHIVHTTFLSSFAILAIYWSSCLKRCFRLGSSTSLINISNQH